MILSYIYGIMIKYDDNYIKNSKGFPVATYACDFKQVTEKKLINIHYHRDFEILYIDKGFADFQISGKVYSVAAGSLILINPFEPHYIEIKSPSYAHRCIDFDVKILDLPEAEQLLSGELSYKNHILNTKALLPYFDLCFNAEISKTAGWEIRAKGALLVLFSLLGGYVGTSISAKEQAFAKEILQFLEENFSADITSAQMAKRLSYNHSYFCRLFKKVFTCSFGEYLNIFRITKAKELLREHSVSQTAMLSGFSSVSYFSLVFKKITGLSPLQYKNEK